MAPEESGFLDVSMAGWALDAVAAQDVSGKTAMSAFYGMQSRKTSMQGVCNLIWIKQDVITLQKPQIR